MDSVPRFVFAKFTVGIFPGGGAGLTRLANTQFLNVSCRTTSLVFASKSFGHTVASANISGPHPSSANPTKIHIINADM